MNMNTMSQTSSSLISLDFDIQAVFRRTGADILMFLTAILAYWVLHCVKTRAASVKTHSKASLISADQECPSERSNDTIDVQPPSKQVKAAATVDIELPKPKTQQHQPSRASIAQVLSSDAKVQAVQLCPAVPRKAPMTASQIQSLMRNYAAARNIKETLNMFRSIQQSGECLTSAPYNAVLQAWVNCGNIWAAENFMEEVKESGLRDATSFAILIKALVMVRDLEKARALLYEMQHAVATPSSQTFDELLFCLARAGLFNDGILLLKHMQEAEVEPTHVTLCAIMKLVSGARAINLRCSEVRQVLSKYDFESKCADETGQNYYSELPRLAAVISEAERETSTKCVHDVEIKGSGSEIKAICGTLTQNGFLEKLGACTQPLVGRHDNQQDQMHRAQIAAVLRCVSRQGLGMPLHLEGAMLQYLGSDPHFLRLNFESNSIRAPMLDEISCRHPRLGFRHCWVKPTFGSCGQRTFSNGEEIDEASFNRHISAVFH